MKKKLRYLVLPAVIVAVAGTGIWAVASERSDCPGKIMCPITGETICADQCPVTD